MKKTGTIAYLIYAVIICIWFSVAASSGWRGPGIFVGSGSSGRAFGGSWGGGK